MSSNIKKKLFTALVMLVGLTVGVTLLKSKPQPEPLPVPEPALPKVIVLETSPGQQALPVVTQGTVQPRREIDLVAQVAGKVVEVAPTFAEGGFFDQGQQLLRIEQSDYRFALSRAEARVAEAEQLLATEKGRARQAKREWRDLGNREANDLFLRKPQLTAAKASLLAAKADRDQARLNLQRTEITAPFNGRLRETFVDLGQFVNAGAKIARFYNTDVVEVRLPLTDQQVALLDLPLSYHNGTTAPQSTVELTANFAGQDWQWQGVITRTDASIDLQSRLVYAVAEITKPFEALAGSQRPPLSIGQFVQATIAGKALDHVLLLPRSALQAENKLWQLDEDNRLQPLAAKVLYRNGKQVAVQMTGSEPVRVVVSALNVAVPGMRVEVDEAPAGSAVL